MVIHVKFHEGVISYIGELLSLDCLYFFKDFLKSTAITKQWLESYETYTEYI